MSKSIQYLFIIIFAVLFLSSCSLHQKRSAETAKVVEIEKVEPLAKKQNTTIKSKIEDRKAKKVEVAISHTLVMEDSLVYLRKKYAPLLNTLQDSIKNLSLYKLVDDWMGTPYKYGGQSLKGTDCSGFAGIIYDSIFKLDLARRVYDIYGSTPIYLKKEELREGDLVFFDIGKRKLSHIGIYLTNGKFVHASTSQGVVISDLSMDYYRRYFRCGGRIIKS